MVKLTLAKQLETAKEAHTVEYHKRLQAERELAAAKKLILDEQEDNRRLRNELMSKSLEMARMEGISQERNRADRAAAHAARPQVMVPLEEHPAYRERHSHVGMDFEAFGHAATERKEWYHR